MQNKVKDHQASLAPECVSARKVFSRAEEGIKALDEWLGDPFSRAVNLIASIEGRVILSGMGKSGHVARKIAATLASTGTPAVFVHPAEASHGDLGMVTEKDVVVLLSNSGETKELKDMVFYCKRFSIPMIGIVRRQKSALVETVDLALVLPEVPEATSVNAPTTSTTMMLVLGDALSVALLERKGFDAEQFSTYHPGGKLGSAFLKVSALMHKGKSLPLVHESSLMTEVLIEMTKKSLGCAVVVDDKNVLKGIVTDGDLRRHMKDSITTLQAQEVMTANPFTIPMNTLATEALAMMEKRAITSLVVTDGSHPKGVLHIHDILRAGVA
jgi:arabinose-5-phosphate isomerase